MTWEELLDEFRALGGVAENIRLGEGALGRGIFVIDPSKPVALHCPDELQVAMPDIVVDGTHMYAVSGSVGERARAFFAAYQEYFGWGAPGAYQPLYDEQAAWHALPAELRERINDLAMLNIGEMRFRAPDRDVCRHNYLHSRTFLRDNTSYIVPMTDLVNHSGFVPGYVYTRGIGVEGTFSDEVLVRYNDSDPWGHLLHYGFTSTGPTAFSLAITIALRNGRNLSIARNVGDFKERAGLRFPVLSVDSGDQLVLSHLVLGFQGGKDLPRAIFRKAMENSLSPAEADMVFENIQHYNRTQFLGFLRTLRKYTGPLVRMFEDAAINQLEALDACIGARAL